MSASGGRVLPAAAVGAAVRLVHRYDGRETTLASDVDVADSFLRRARGLIGRRSVPDDYALLFRFDEPATRTLHMVGVPFDIDALWLVGDEVVRKRRLSAWTGLGWGTADRIAELPAGAADRVEPGHEIFVEE